MSEVKDNEAYSSKPTAYFVEQRLEMVDLVPIDAKRILDVGCSAGGFGAAVKSRREVEIWGIEMMPKAASAAAEVLDKVLPGTFQDCWPNLPRKHFDCIVFNDVLEHMEDPYAVLRDSRELLGSNGSVVASIPNVRFYEVVRDLVWNGRWNYRDWGVLDRTHLRFFTRQSIAEAFTNAGYVIDRLYGINPAELSREYRILNFLSGGRLAEMRYPQFAVRAKLAVGNSE